MVCRTSLGTRVVSNMLHIHSLYYIIMKLWRIINIHGYILYSHEIITIINIHEYILSVAKTYRFATPTLKLSRNRKIWRYCVITSRRRYIMTSFFIWFIWCDYAIPIFPPNLKQIRQETRPQWPKNRQNLRYDVITSRRRYVMTSIFK